jgi:diguanylate cyclase (GGDEF)-like protein
MVPIFTLVLLMQSINSTEEFNAGKEAKGLVHTNLKEAVKLLDAVICRYHAEGKDACALAARRWQCFALIANFDYDLAKKHLAVMVVEAEKIQHHRYVRIAKMYFGLIAFECDEVQSGLEYLGEVAKSSADPGAIALPGDDEGQAKYDAVMRDLEQKTFDQDVLRLRNKSLIERNKALELEARYDPLSGLLNRRGTEEALQQFTERRFATRFLIALLDIDHFKRINDKFGHAIGDQVINEFSNCLVNSSKNPAKIGRWGGEEFLIVFDITDDKEMDEIGLTLVSEIRSLNWDHIHVGMKVTASVGLSMWCQGDSLDNAIRIADDMLYDVKHHGRDNWRAWPLDEVA